MTRKVETGVTSGSSGGPDASGEEDGARIRFGGEWSVVRLLVGLCGRRAPALVFIVFLAGIAFLLEGIGIGLLIPLLRIVFASGEEVGSSGPLTEALLAFANRLPSDNRLIWLAVAVFLLVLAKTVVIYGHHVVSVWLSGHVGSRLRQDLFRRALGFGLLSAQRLGVGRLHNTIDAQVWQVTDGLDTLTRLIASVAAAVVFVTLLLLLSWQLTAFVVAGFGTVSLLMTVARCAAQRFGRHTVEANVDLSTRIVESLTHHRLIRAFGAEGAETKRFEEAAEGLRRAVLRTEMVRGIVTPGTELLHVPLMFGTMVFGLTQDQGMSTLLAFLLLLYRLVPHLRNVDYLRVELASLNGPIEDVATVLAMPEDAPRSGHRRLSRIEHGVRFDDIHFHYPDVRGGLSGVSFEILKGSVVALVGPSGAGKSTVVNLLYRFFDPGAGRVLVDGVPLVELDLADWRHRLALAGQDIELMQGTIRDNIAFGRPSADEEEIRAAAREANAEEFIETLPDRYGTRVGSRGLSLSGGQRQRLSLARALLRRPDLLILDEATNALDGVSEEIVLERLDAARGTMSVLVIAHRMSTIRKADLVVVLDQGRVVECGPPATLIRDAGAFRRLWDLERV